ncbi:MAG: ribonuclease HII, partial [Candidatus Heimdallarchaeota archaeon]|nr:ribonuclease HII [Candidatus Heimdallarchaeota archaeon]
SIIEQLDAEYGPLGTGYMNDPRTQRFLQKWLQTHEAFPQFVRSSWAPCKKMLIKKQNSTLKDYFPCQ